jgi:hypothetical protein
MENEGTSLQEVVHIQRVVVILHYRLLLFVVTGEIMGGLAARGRHRVLCLEGREGKSACGGAAKKKDCSRKRMKPVAVIYRC